MAPSQDRPAVREASCHPEGRPKSDKLESSRLRECLQAQSEPLGRRKSQTSELFSGVVFSCPGDAGGGTTFKPGSHVFVHLNYATHPPWHVQNL